MLGAAATMCALDDPVVVHEMNQKYSGTNAPLQECLVPLVAALVERLAALEGEVL